MKEKSKKSENLGRCGRQNVLRPYLKIWNWDWIFGRALKTFSSLGVRSPWYDLLLELGGNKTNCPLCTYQIGRCLLTFFFQSARQSLDRSNNSELLRHFYIIFISKKMSKTKIFFDLKKKFDITDIHYMKTVVRLEIMSHGNNFEWLVKKCWLGCISLKQRT